MRELHFGFFARGGRWSLWPTRRTYFGGNQVWWYWWRIYICWFRGGER